jgi:hypothetical protein
MSDDFCAEDFMPVKAAIVKAAHCWFPEPLERAVPQLATSDSNIDAAVQALWQLNRAEWPWDAIKQTVTRLRNYLHQAKITAYYFTKDARQVVAQNFWATSEADDVLESGLYWPDGYPSIIDHGEPSTIDEQRRPPTLFFMQSELDALLSQRPTVRKRSFSSTEKQKLVEALRKLGHLTRPDQFTELQKSFPNLTHRVFREGAKQVPRKAGRRR